MYQDNNYLLCLNQFERNIKAKWQELQTEKDLCDMTLACEDKQILTHKIIISSSSPIFQNILKQNSNPHPVIYLRGVKYKYLQNLINFMHQGVVNVAEKDLGDFLEVAEDLKIRGLSGESFNPNHKLSREVYKNSKEPSPKRKFHETSLTNIFNYIPEPETISLPPKLEDDYLRNNIFVEIKGERNIVEKTENDKNNELLIDVNGGKQFSCDICAKQYVDFNVLRRHKASVHQGVGYPCDECDVSTYSSSRNLRRHKASKHKGVKFPCDECDISPFSDKSNLGRHKASAHKGVKYKCNHCDYKATQKSNLKHHSERVHNL